MTIEEKLQHFAAFSMETARENCDRMLGEHEAALEQIFQEHQEAKKRQEDLELKTETDQLIRENNKRFAEEQIQIRRTLSSRQNEIKDKLFVEIKDQLARFAETPAYHQLLVKQLKEALAFADGEEVVLYIDPSDAERRLSLEVEVGAPIIISSYSFVGGTRAVIPGRNILIDQSFETRLAEEREKFQLKGGQGRE